MAFNQLLWSVHGKVTKKLLEENPSPGLEDIAPYNWYPTSTQIFVENFEKIVKEYQTLDDFIDFSTGQCSSSLLESKGNSLYLEAFSNGLSSVLQNMNSTLVAIEQSFLNEASISTTEILVKFEHVNDVLSSLNLAVKELNVGKYLGCKILDLCESMIIGGSDPVKNTFRKINDFCMKEFFKQTKLWIIQGVLYDPFNEFFISSVDDFKSSSTSLSNLSSGTIATVGSTTPCTFGLPKFQVNPNNLPRKVPLSVAIKIVFIGEALLIFQNHDFKSECNDLIFNEQSITSQFSKIESKGHCNLEDFTVLIDDLWVGVNKYIRQVSDDVGNVKDQLNLMWEIYLLGRGELFQEFLQQGSSILNADVTQVDSRNLNKVFKDAVYYVYLTENSYIIDEFSFKLPQRTALRKGSTTWSNMRLKWTIKWPLHYLFTPDVMSTYNRLFLFLLKLKKALIDATAWKSITSVRNHSLRMEFIEVRMYLLSLVGNLYNYCFTNVIANEMTILLEAVKSTTLFTDLQKALSMFLTNICNRLFLPDPKYSGSSNFDETFASQSVDANVEVVHKCFRKIFSLCGTYSELINKNDNHVHEKLTSLKSELLRVLKSLFSFLRKINQSHYSDSRNSDVHFYDLMMCLDYNDFFRNKFNLQPED